MRKFIDLINLFESKLPDLIYHGTSEDAYESIKSTNEMMAMDDHDRAICFTESRSVAEEFARNAALADMCEKGVVVAFDTKRLSQLYPITQHHDSGMAGSWRFFVSEHEYRIEQPQIKNIMSCVVSTYSVWTESSPEMHDPKSDSEIIAAAVDEIRDQYAPNFEGKCEGAIGDLSDILHSHHILHRVVEGRYLRPMKWGDGTTHPFTPHWWIVVGNYILDPTREQFGSSNLIVNKNHKEAYLYAESGVENNA